jgi:hypothetical protein
MPNSGKPIPIDPAASPKWALAGRIVTMDPNSTVVMDGAVWIADAAIAAITKRGDPVPEAFDGVVPLETGGTVLPGLIELHNHLAYNALPLWNVPRKYTNRDQWGNTPIYHQLPRDDDQIGALADLQNDPAPLTPLFEGDERTVQLVAINGTPRYGTPALLVADGPGLETLTVGGQPRVLYLAQTTEDPDVAALGYAQAQAKLADALENIKAIRLEQERGHGPEALAAAPAVRAGHPRLALDEFEHTDFTQRPHLELDGIVTGPVDRPQASAPPISSLLSPITLDPLTVADDPGWLDIVDHEINLPDYLAPGLRALYQA